MLCDKEESKHAMDVNFFGSRDWLKVEEIIGPTK